MRSTRALRGILVLATIVATFPGITRARLLDRVGIYAGYWDQSLEGNGRIDGTIRGDDFSFNDDLGLDGEEGVVEVGAWIRLIGRHRLRASTFSASLDGNTTLPRTIVAGDSPYPAGTPVTSSLDFKLHKAHYNYSFVNFDRVNAGLLLGVDFVDGSASLTSLATTEQGSAKGPIPVLGVNLEISPVGFFRAYAEVSGANWKLGDVDTELRDIIVRAEFYFAHFFGIGAGYRKLDLEAEEEGEGRIDVSTDGYAAYLLLRF